MKKIGTTLMSFVVALAFVVSTTPVVFAASAANASDNMSRQKISEISDHVITFDLPTALPGAGTITVTLPVGFTGTGATATANWAVAGNVATYTAPSPQSAGATYAVTLTGFVNPATAGNQVIAIASSNGDSGQITVPIVTDDQIQVTAQVDQILFFDVRDGIGGTATDNAVQFGTLTSGSARYATDAGTGSAVEAAASEFEAGTNAGGGYIVDVTGETLTAMDGSGNTIDGLFTPAASVAGTSQFGINVTQTQASTGATTGTITADYATNYHLPDTATTENLVTNTGPSSNEIYDVTYLANISSLTPAGNYTTALTFTMTANY